MTTKQIAQYGLLTSIILVLGLVERQFVLVPGIPGIRLGLSNIVLLYALCLLSMPGAWLMMVLKAVLGGMLYAGPTGAAYSFAGGLLSMAVMTLFLQVRYFGLVGVSVAGAVAHMAGQILLSRVLLGSWAALAQAPLLLAAAVLTGVFTGVIATLVCRAMARLDPAMRRRLDALGLGEAPKAGSGQAPEMRDGTIVWVKDGLRLQEETLVCLGFFDGVHIGHQQLLKRAREVAAGKGWKVCVHTFDRSPAAFLRPEAAVRELTTLEQKARLLRGQGADIVAVSRFDEAMARMSARDFFDEVLIRRLHARHIVAGFHHTFGYRGEGNAETLAALCRENHIGLDVIEPVTLPDGELVSSTAIRQALLSGDCAKAEAMLGRPCSPGIMEKDAIREE